MGEKRLNSFFQRVFQKIDIRRLFKNAQMQVELCEIPLAGALEILRSEVYWDVLRNDEG